MTINSFKDKYAFLSNFYPCKITFEGLQFATLEHAFQAAKTINPEERLMVQLAATPAKAKRIGRKITLREDWNEIKIQIMRDLLLQKFSRNHRLRQLLFNTGNIQLIEGNTWGDQFWGMVYENGQWVGENHLGKLLMNVREEICSNLDNYYF